MHLFLFSPANRPAGTLVCMNFKRHETDEYYDIVALRHTMQAVQGLGGGVHMQTHFASERAHVQQLQAHRSHRCHQNSGVQQCCSPLTYTSARLIVVSAWNHFIITDHRCHTQPDLSFFRAFGCATVVIEAGTSWSTPNWHHWESWACTWVSAPVTVVVPL